MLATGFVTNGAKVYICSRRNISETKINEIIKKSSEMIGLSNQLKEAGEPSCTGIQADITKDEDIAKVINYIKDKEDGKLDILINNSGTNWNEVIEDYPSIAWDKVLSLNLKALFRLTQLCLPLLIKSYQNQVEVKQQEEENTVPSKNENGKQPRIIFNPRIINIGSIDGLTNRTTLYETYAYSSSKAAVHKLTEVLAGHLSRKGILVNAIAAGPFESKMMKVTLERAREEIESNIPLGRIGQPSDICGLALYLASPSSSFITGAVIPLDGGIMISPRL